MFIKFGTVQLHLRSFLIPFAVVVERDLTPLMDGGEIECIRRLGQFVVMIRQEPRMPLPKQRRMQKYIVFKY